MSEDKSKKAQPEISDEELEGVAGGGYNSAFGDNGSVTISTMPSRKPQFSGTGNAEWDASLGV